jgi:hypothetical protein
MNEKIAKMEKIRMRRSGRKALNKNNTYEIENSLIANENDPNYEKNSQYHNSFKSKLNKKKYDSFKRTGIPFGSLWLEIKHRYKYYFDDIRDGLNLHCLIAFICIFTVCIAPGLW